ncbi:DUF1566 domain-containing protein [Halomonas rhizosphaerae]|uniref:Lcl C-terminal domain-containing protein n=1 Tax=Halomonas rhizosphaerae TaxID=3043296 RepID=A0ABT6UY40_9GAMM|nr:DUF1566 domain-containing protein [Halomonas rhizosphaerae]MDI5890591.1 hypothetical protein [Halomonas rhizosphaerae]
MARRVSWTNNSSGHSGTYVYRAPTLDPQNLPAPVATVDPVGQGETGEWIDDFTGYECYAVQDFDGQGVGALSAEVCITDPWAGVQVGDEVEGGIYAGIDTIDGTDYHIIAGLESSEVQGLVWKPSYTDTPGAESMTDGLANTQDMEAAGLSSHPAAEHCVNYAGGGYNDWHLPAQSQLALMYNNLRGHPEFATNVSSAEYTWTSTESSATSAIAYGLHNNVATALGKKTTTYFTRPVRRVAV